MVFLFFFSSRRRHTRWTGDWSSDVCSSDLGRLTIDDVNPVWLKTPAAPIVGSLVEEMNIDIEQILAAFRALQNRVEHVIVEGVGGWLVPIRPDYFVGDLAV